MIEEKEQIQQERLPFSVLSSHGINHKWPGTTLRQNLPKIVSIELDPVLGHRNHFHRLTVHFRRDHFKRLPLSFVFDTIDTFVTPSERVRVKVRKGEGRVRLNLSKERKQERKEQTNREEERERKIESERKIEREGRRKEGRNGEREGSEWLLFFIRIVTIISSLCPSTDLADESSFLGPNLNN